jgi:hypothetical protein
LTITLKAQIIRQTLKNRETSAAAGGVLNSTLRLSAFLCVSLRSSATLR